MSLEIREDFAELREAVLLLLRKDQLAVGDDVELRSLALDRARLVAAVLELGREAHGPRVVAASDRAVEDLDARHSGETLHGDAARRRTARRQPTHEFPQAAQNVVPTRRGAEHFAHWATTSRPQPSQCGPPPRTG